MAGLKPAPRAQAPLGSGAWRTHPTWSDGHFECALYEARVRDGGRERDGCVLLIGRREPSGALRFQIIEELGGSVLAPRTSLSFLVGAERGALHGLEASRTDAVGLDHVLWEDAPGGLAPPALASMEEEVWPEETLPVRLREYVAGRIPHRLAIARALDPGRPAILHRMTRSAVATESGQPPAVAITLESRGRQLRYVFEAAAPHLLLELEDSAGRHYRLSGRVRAEDARSLREALEAHLQR